MPRTHNTTYTFTMPAQNVTVSATFEQELNTVSINVDDHVKTVVFAPVVSPASIDEDAADVADEISLTSVDDIQLMSEDTKALTSTASFDGDTTFTAYSDDTGHLKVYSTQFRDWGSSDGTVKVNSGGSIAFYTFDISSVGEDSITKAEFKATVSGLGDGGGVQKIRLLGYNGDEPAAAGAIANNAGTILGTVTDTGSFQPLDTKDQLTANAAQDVLTGDATTYVTSAHNAEKTKVTIAVIADYTRDLYLAKDATLTLTTTSDKLYTATFTETNGLEPTVTVYSDEGMQTTVRENELLDGNTYYYKAVLAGYKDKTGSFEVSGANPTVTFTMEEADKHHMKVTTTIDGVDHGDALVDEDVAEGITKTVSFPMYLTDESHKVLAKIKTEGTYTKSYTMQTEDITETIEYTAYEGEAYFIEGEDLGSTGPTTQSNLSGGKAVRGVTEGKDAFTVTTDGQYRATVVAFCRNTSNSSTATVYKNSATDENKIAEGDAKGASQNAPAKLITYNIPLAANDKIILAGDAGQTNIDYFLLEKTNGEPTKELEAQQLASGTYTITVTTDEGYKLDKIIVGEDNDVTATKQCEISGDTEITVTSKEIIPD